MKAKKQGKFQLLQLVFFLLQRMDMHWPRIERKYEIRMEIKLRESLNYMLL